MQLSRQSPLIRHHEFVYVILAHGRGEGLSRLVSTLRKGSPDSAIVIHFDRKSEPPPDLSALVTEGLYLVDPRIDVAWGGFSLLEAILTSLRFVADRMEFSWLSLISGNDYPIRPLGEIEDELRKTDFDAFVKAQAVSREEYAARYYMQYCPLPRFRHLYRVPWTIRQSLSAMRRWINGHQHWIRLEGGVRGTRTVFGHLSSKHPFSENFVCFKGSGWFTLSARALTYLLSFEATNPQVLRWYRRTWIPDESYIQTVLLNARSLTLCSDHRRYIDWDPAHLSHPKTLTIDDLPALLSSANHFARKIETETGQALLDALDHVVLGRTVGTSGLRT